MNGNTASVLQIVTKVIVPILLTVTTWFLHDIYKGQRDIVVNVAKLTTTVEALSHQVEKNTQAIDKDILPAAQMQIDNINEALDRVNTRIDRLEVSRSRVYPGNIQ